MLTALEKRRLHAINSELVIRRKLIIENRTKIGALVEDRKNDAPAAGQPLSADQRKRAAAVTTETIARRDTISVQSAKMAALIKERAVLLAKREEG